MAEQDKYGNYFADKVKNPPSPPSIGVKDFEGASGAEQDRYGGWFGGKAKAPDISAKDFQGTSGAEQDRYGGWFGGKAKAPEISAKDFQGTSGAEQDRYGGWFGGKAKAPEVPEISAKDFQGTSGAEQDRYGGWFGGKAKAPPISSKDFQGVSGAEQDRYASHFGHDASNPLSGSSRVSVKNSPDASWNQNQSSLGAEQDRYASHFTRGAPPAGAMELTTIGILRSTILPSFALHSGISAIAYGIGRLTNRADAKDWIWPSAQVANVWWSAIGSRVLYGGLTLGQAWSILSYEEKLLLGGVTAWGTRLFYLVASKSIARGHDDARYVEAKKDPGFWNKAAYQTFLPEAIMQTIITLPFTLPFRSGVESMSLSPTATFPSIAYHLAIFLFGAGFALETLADTQLAAHKEKSKALNQDGVWSIVRHPNYLGDTLVHSAFPFLLYSTGLLHPIAVLGPIANYVFLRYVGGDAENEASQEERYSKNDPAKLRQLQQYRATKNSFWPRVQEFTNPWFLTVVGAGVGTVLVERGIRALVA